MYELFARDLRDNVTVIELKKMLGVHASLNLLRNALQDLYHKDELIYFGKGAEDDTDWRLTQKGIEQAEYDREFISSLEIQINELLRDYRDGKSSTENKNYDEWQPLPLEVGTPQVVEAATAVEEVIEAVRSDNGYSATYPEEQKSILWALGSGINALREGLITRYALDNFLINPLKKLIERFADAVLQVFAKKALEKVLALFSGS